MDGSTEPMVCFIGHPIAGNPSQLAMERALRSVGLDWRVLSLDVAPADIVAAVEGLRVCGFRGLLIDPTAQPATLEDDFYFYRDGQWTGSVLRDEVLANWLVAGDSANLADDATHEQAATNPLGSTTPLGFIGPPRPGLSNLLAASSDPVIVVTAEPPDWSEALDQLDIDPEGPLRMVIDDVGLHPGLLAERFPKAERIMLREQLLGALVLRAAELWTNQRFAPEVIEEALEEYFSV
ncbi:MAG: hypothetical protein AAF958_03785 [Planctomycetota bacterium]